MNILSVINNLIKRTLFRCSKSFRHKQFGKVGSRSVIPKDIEVSNPSNIFIDEHVLIGGASILYATNAQISIGRYFVSGNGLKISTGEHERRVGRFLSSISENEKNHNIGLDKDVIINEDVWAGFNVLILSGTIIGRGCTVAAGSVVTKSLPPYSICGGVPARFIKFYWSIDQILEHEEKLYKKEERISREDLEQLFNNYSKK